MADIYTQAGEELIVDVIDGTISPPTYHVGWGTGGDTADKSDTTLSTESAETRIVTAQSQPSVDINEFKGTITASAGRTITNAGILSLITGGVLILFSDFVGVVLANGDKIEFTFTLEQT